MLLTLRSQAETLLDQPKTMNELRLQKAFSDVSPEVKQYIHEMNEQAAEKYNNNGDFNDNKEEEEEEEEVKQVECDCCGLKEDCTIEYINRIKSSYSGKWVCGLCAEVVNETLRRNSKATTQINEALEWHRGFCQNFNSTTRQNPKLSFTYSMKEIAKRSCQNRSSKVSSGLTKITRTVSCNPRIDI